MKDNGGPAFPQNMVETYGGGMTCGWDGYGLGGMSLRDYFAIHATEADWKPFVREYDVQTAQTDHTEYTRVVPGKATTPTWFARYQFADAMLKAREDAP